MSMRLIEAVRQHSRAKGTARMVLLFLAHYANDEGIAWPSQATLAQDANITDRSVRDALALLVALGEIIRVVRGRRATVTWQITLPEHAHEPAKSGSPAPDLTCAKSGSPAPDLNSNPEAQRRLIRRPASGKSGGQLPGICHRSQYEPSKEAAAVEQAAFDLWNQVCESTGLKPVTRLTSERRKLLTARLAECGGPDGWAAALLKIDQTPGLRGQGSRGFCVKFDWLLKETNFAKLMEGFYDGWDPSRPANGGTGKKSGRQDRLLAGLAAAVEAREDRRRRRE